MLMKPPFGKGSAPMGVRGLAASMQGLVTSSMSQALLSVLHLPA